MPVSSFFGMQTSLKGLLAHQRMLDTTGHNIANASTQGYSRQEAMLQASPALRLTLSNGINTTGAQLGSGVDVTGFRRVRDQFLDSQYRAQNTNLNEWSAKAEALDSAELSLAEPGENGINAQLAKVWNAWSDFSKHPTTPSAKQALVQTSQGLTDSIHSVRSQMVAAQEMAQGQYQDIVGEGGQVDKIATEIADLNKTIAQFMSIGEPPNDLMDRRDVLVDQLSNYGQVSVEALEGGSMNVSFVDRTNGTAYPIVTDQTATWDGPPIGDWNPGGEMGGLLAVGKSPGGTIDGYLAQIDTITQSLASAVNGIYGGEFFTVGTPAGATIKVADAIVADPNSVIAGSGTGASSNDIALQISQLRGNASIDGAYKSFVAKVGGDLSEAQRLQGNAQILTDSVENRRQSVQGVSMDEEMSNLVRFQRAYQASARAMSTMDEMLDVLINRTGKVGL
ncbi:flagellar hook-associated protein FlgK [Solirubrobacter sp. CPCC 204708]|uniref:Flagellar hook-associated protein 1 n=1 Tax=Solirubrobacter deserti TaxID=2282478 RepID=A0ABT4RMY1_9ACTN|nr:flagellar hook-associated protein FlgK [Solirubrobacter deserti]MBE2316952.1 flagellar hook-associated protein FlgK [Solirubrobacter deserti]MDA0139783.1 flagellar hook-associated protein FlgK [Solirubrobacter deserti]